MLFRSNLAAGSRYSERIRTVLAAGELRNSSFLYDFGGLRVLFIYFSILGFEIKIQIHIFKVNISQFVKVQFTSKYWDSLKKNTLFLISILFLTSIYGQYKDIRAGINGLLKQVPAGTQWSVLIIDAETMDTVYTYGHRNLLTPASNTKVVTSAAALHLLGGDYELSTQFRYSGSVNSSGVLKGNLYLKALGNPMMTSSDLINFAKAAKKIGIKSVEGDIVGDDTFFDSLYFRSQYVGGSEADWETQPLSALVLDQNNGIKGNRFTTAPVFISEKLRGYLAKEGIRVTGKSVAGRLPQNTRLISSATVRLFDMLKVMNKRSDNFYAEYTMKLISAAVTGARGSTKDGIRLCFSFLYDSGAFIKGTAIFDGSGLSHRNKIPTGVIVKIYQYIYSNYVFRSEFFATLSISGIDGTLRGRMQQQEGENNLHGKTGTLTGVITLSGFFTTKKGRNMIGAVFFNYRKGDPKFYRELQDKIFNLLIKKL
ncbi:MAG: D-alanyl-D-alanine carboxypeptidase/D-alanyl-D-alanine-endopeptidase [Ignavibacteriaceae bacterium]|nr:MAG: D-alanyl-D-alanine carboxypeptidase/D-alanyl-D-alanine-endopeptidase [Ignavibacteriaceae bacterium]